MRPKFSIYINNEWIDHEKTVLKLLQQLKDGGLTVREAYFVLDQAKREIERSVMDAPIMS